MDVCGNSLVGWDWGWQSSLWEHSTCSQGNSGPLLDGSVYLAWMPDQRYSCSCHFDASLLVQRPRGIWVAGAVHVDELEVEDVVVEEQEQHRACTVGEGHIHLGCGEAGRVLLWEDTGQNGTLTDVG